MRIPLKYPNEILKICLMMTKSNHLMYFVKFGDFLMFYQIFLSPQVTRCAIITYKDGIYKLSHELLYDLRLRRS